MNILAIDIGNSNIGIGLYLSGEADTLESIPGDNTEALRTLLIQLWEKIPVVALSKEGKRDGVIVVSSVRPAWTEQIKQLAREELDEVFGPVEAFLIEQGDGNWKVYRREEGQLVTREPRWDRWID